MAWKRFEIFLIQAEYRGCFDYRPFLIINPFDGRELRGYFLSGTEDLHSGSAYASAYSFPLPSYREDFPATNLEKDSFIDAETLLILEHDDLHALKKTRKGRLQGNLLKEFARWIGINDLKSEEIEPE